MTLDEFLALPAVDGMEALARLPERERTRLAAEYAAHQQQASRSAPGPVRRYRPSREEPDDVELD